MEKFRIALYGMAQVTAIVYGVLAARAAVKLNRIFADQGFTLLFAVLGTILAFGGAAAPPHLL